MRWIAGLFMLLLGGCGVAVSDKPMLTEHDIVGAPQFENGVWWFADASEDNDCVFESAQPVSKWPKCADWVLHRNGIWFVRDGESGIAIKSVPDSAVSISSGDVAIVQLFDPNNVAAPEDADPTPYSFVAFANRSTATEKLRSVSFWIVMCGTYARRRAPEDDETAEEFVRYPGFDEKCQPASLNVLRDAAEKSRSAQGAPLLRFQWLRAALD